MQSAKRFWTVLCFAMLVMVGGLASAPQAAAQCIESAIVRAPDQASPGEVIGVAAGFYNCGREDARVGVSFYLVQPNAARILIGQGRIAVPAGERTRQAFRMQIPDRVRSGQYQLVMVTHGRNAIFDIDRTRIAIR